MFTWLPPRAASWVSLDETVLVSGRREIVIPLPKVKHPNDKESVDFSDVVKPVMMSRKQLNIEFARTTVQPKSNRSAVKRVNIYPTPVTMYTNSKVGIIQPVGRYYRQVVKDWQEELEVGLDQCLSQERPPALQHLWKANKRSTDYEFKFRVDCRHRRYEITWVRRLRFSGESESVSLGLQYFRNLGLELRYSNNSQKWC